MPEWLLSKVHFVFKCIQKITAGFVGYLSLGLVIDDLNKIFELYAFIQKVISCTILQ